MAERFVETPFGCVYAQTQGDETSPLVLAVHGFSQRNGWRTWEPLMRPLADAGYYVVSVDMPGWGQSTATGFDPLNVFDGISTLEAIIVGLGREQAAAVMGKSWGGGLALSLALEKPTRMRQLILSAPAFSDFGRLRTLEQPVLLAWAKDDPTIPFGVAARYEAAVPELELVTYAEGGHNAAPNNADDFAPRAIDFLNRLNVEIDT